MIEQWYWINVTMLREIFGQVDFDDIAFLWIYIPDFDLPPIYQREKTKLLITTPGTAIENCHGYSFYAEPELRRRDEAEGVHLIYESGYNDLKYAGFARLSFHLENFRPTADVISGDTIVDIVQAVHNFMAMPWKS